MERNKKRNNTISRTNSIGGAAKEKELEDVENKN
jgi:hypothetical protein